MGQSKLHLRSDGVETRALMMKGNVKNREGEVIVPIDESVEDEELDVTML